MSLPTLYEYYTSGPITSGLSADSPNFTLNDKPITFYSGAMHYFRVPPAYWRDRLRKMRAAGLNAVETYVPWNLHEPQMGVFDFGDGSGEFGDLTNVKAFLEVAQQEDLLAIVRPGPYICAEWEFGGLPSWLLRSDTIKIRTSDPAFIDPVRKYFTKLMAVLAPLQFSKGGPIIAFQIENEYGNTKEENIPIDTVYLQTLREIMLGNGIVELLFTSDTPANGFAGTLPGVLATANFQDKPVFQLALLKEHQPNRPLMVMEYWTGWFDHWAEKHHTRTVEEFGGVLEEILAFNSSVNMYMFHGATNWGFLNGANILNFITTDNGDYMPDTTSYDYDAPLSEAGDYTDKYHKVKELIEKHNRIKTKLPNPPEILKKIAYNSVNITGKLTMDDLIEQLPYSTTSKKLIPMEMLDINNKSGQSYGYIIYRKENLTLLLNSVLKIEGRVCDTVMVLINGELKSKILQKGEDLNDFGYWRRKDSTLNLGAEAYKSVTLELIVENWGRNNFGRLNQFNQHKGLWQGDVLINDEIVTNWRVYPLEFKKSWTNSLSNWKPAEFKSGPALYKGVLSITDDVFDTYIDMRKWNKGVVIVNGFVLARYLKLGPQQTAYLPAPLLKKGDNDIVIFEHFSPIHSIDFVDHSIFEALV